MFIIRLVFLCLWLLISCVLGTIFCVFRWGNPSNNSIFARVFAIPATKICSIRVAIYGREHLLANQPCIYVASHQSAVDLATYGLLFPTKTLVIGKKELKWIPGFGLYFMASGNIMIDRKNRRKAVAGLGEAVNAARDKGLSIWIFPEGTRNVSGEGLLPFKRGAFHTAIAAGIPIVPLVQSPFVNLISWKNKVLGGGSVEIRILPPISTAGMTSADVEKLSNLTRSKMLEALPGLTTRLDHP